MTASNPATARGGTGTHRTGPAFVFVHGGFHGAWTWHDVIPLLAAAGHASVAIDLPGAGSRTAFPRSFLACPIDAEAFAREPSPVSDVTQVARTDATVEAVRQAANAGDGTVVLVGHSWGGLTISHVAEAVPDQLHAIVYLTALLIPDGATGGELFQHSTFSTSEVGTLFIGDPAIHGAALRLNPRSDDPAYRETLRRAFYHDVPAARSAAIAHLLHCDEPLDTASFPMRITAERFGSVARHYIRMGDDRTLPPPAQDHMVDRFDRSGIGGSTTVHRMAGSHSPMFAQPQALVEVLLGIAN